MFNKKKKFFKDKIKEVEKTLWDLDFKVFKARGMREESRQHRDRSVEQLNSVSSFVGKEKDPATLEKLEAEKKFFTEDVAKYEAQMKMIDDQINGNNEGEQGILEVMKALGELKRMYTEYASQL